MKKIYILLVALFAFFYTGTAFSQDLYFSAVGSNNAGGASVSTSGTLTAGASPTLDAPLKNYSKITSFQYGFTNSAAVSSSTGGGGSGRTQLNALTITKNVDLASTRLMQAGLSGVLLSSAQILITKSSGGPGGPTIVYKIDLKNAFITQFDASAAAGGGCSGGCVTESFAIIYEAIKVTTYTQNNDGSITPNPPASFSQKTNTPTF